MTLILSPRGKILAFAILFALSPTVVSQIQAASSGQVTINRTTIDYSTNKITIDTSALSAEQAADAIVDWLEKQGLIHSA